jgi:hypothetical protein
MPSPISSFQTRIDVAPEVRQRVIAALNQQLSQTLDLYTQAKQAHWNVKGTEFFQLHELFDKVAEKFSSSSTPSPNASPPWEGTPMAPRGWPRRTRSCRNTRATRSTAGSTWMR